MRFTLATLAAATALTATAAPYKPFPLANGFPSPDASAVAAIEKAAGGTLPNGPLPSSLTAGATATLQLIALNELFEVAYFTSLLSNITNGVSGYKLDDGDYNKTYIVNTITAIQAQEELHALGANAILKNAGKTTIQPCSYQFPVSNFKDAIALAQTFTDVVLGVLPQAQTTFANDGGDEIGLIALLGSIIGQEAQQDGWFRSTQGKIASAAPFLTGGTAPFTFTFLQSVIVPGSCGNIEVVSAAIPTLKPLTVVSGAKPYNSTVTYSVKGSVDPSSQSVAYLSGQNLPVVVSIKSVSQSNGVTTFEASLPFDSGFANGLTLAAVVNGKGPFASGSAVASASVYGPGVIELN